MLLKIGIITAIKKRKNKMNNNTDFVRGSEYPTTPVLFWWNFPNLNQFQMESENRTFILVRYNSFHSQYEIDSD